MTRSRRFTVAAAGICGVIGIAIGISSSAAASSPRLSSGSRGGGPGHWTLFGPAATGATGPGARRGGGFPGPAAGAGAIHSVSVVPTRGGGFSTVTTDRGTLKSIAGDALTVTEGTASATYATPTITVGSSAKVFLDGRSSSLSALDPGDRVTIVQVSGGATTVSATDSSYQPPTGAGPWMGHGFGGRRFRGGPFGGPPPGATGPSGATGVGRPHWPPWRGSTGASGAGATA